MGSLFGDGVEFPKQIFKAICQNKECRVLVGAMHIPCVAGTVIFVCHKCSMVSRFDNGADGYEPKALGKATPRSTR